MKINWNIPHTLIPIPFHIGGFELKYLEIEQTIELISVFITNFTSNLPTRDLLMQLLEYTQLESGLDISFLLQPYDKFHILYSDGWITSLQKALSFHNIQLYLPENFYPISSIKNNCSITYKVFSLGIFDPEQCRLINLVRMKL